MNVGRLIEGSIRGYHLSTKRGLIPHPTTITRLCILAGVKGSWEEEETCPKVTPLTLTSVTNVSNSALGLSYGHGILTIYDN